MSDVERLLPEDEERLIEARAWVAAQLPDQNPLELKEVQPRLGWIAQVLRENQLEPDQTWELQALGVVFGDALAEELGLEWIAVDDEFGRDPALNLPDTPLICYPLTMLSKRVEDGEPIDVYDLFDGIVQEVNRAASAAGAP